MQHVLGLLLTWINFYPSMEKLFNVYEVWDEITQPLPYVKGAAVKGYGYVITYPRRVSN